MMQCQEARAYVSAWEAGKTPSSSQEEFSAHLASCAACAKRYRSLAPLIARDLGPAPGTAPDPTLSRGVMAAIEPRPRRLSSLVPALAAAAALVFSLGIGLGLHFARSNSDLVTVKFSLTAPQASSVYLAGDFNDWSGEEYRLSRVGSSDTWEIKIPLKRGKAYVYNFVIDGQTWVSDPKVPAKIADGFGGSGSLLRL